MGEAISAVLPQALGTAISPIPIVAVILMLFTAKARINAPAFAAGWIFALLLVTAFSFFASDSQDVATDSDASNLAYLVRLGLAVALIMLAMKQWKSRPKSGEPPADPPKWMSSIDKFTPVKAFGMGALLAGPNPKNLLLSIAAGTSIAQAGATGGSAIIAIFVYAFLATVTVAGPVIYYFLAGEQAKRTLTSAREWLTANNATVMFVLFLVLGVNMLSDALRGLFA